MRVIMTYCRRDGDWLLLLLHCCKMFLIVVSFLVLEKVCTVLEEPKLTRGISAVQLIVLKSAAKSYDYGARSRRIDSFEVLLLCLGCRSVHCLENARAVQTGRFPRKSAKMQNIQICSTRHQILALRLSLDSDNLYLAIESSPHSSITILMKLSSSAYFRSWKKNRRICTINFRNIFPCWYHTLKDSAYPHLSL